MQPLGNAAHRRDHRNGGLAAAGHHVHVRRIQVGIAVDDRDRERADRGRRQVDDLLAVALQDLVVADVRLGGGGVENHADLLVIRHLRQPIDALRGHGHAHAGGARQAVGVGVDADHRRHFEMLGCAHHLDHQVGADIARADDRAFDLGHSLFLRECGPDMS